MLTRRVPTRVDRYPGKMNNKLAATLADRFVSKDDCRVVLDPFCGSGALLAACSAPGRHLIGVDLNPVAILLSRVKLQGFDRMEVRETVAEMIAAAQSSDERLEVAWPNKAYWFTAGTLEKFERLRYAASTLRQDLSDRDWSALLLCLAMAVRGCSRADQRSPKPFISATAKASRKGRHYCPYKELVRVREELATAYSVSNWDTFDAKVVLGDVVKGDVFADVSAHCVVTSPPYLNAQDYFRNTKLELYVLEGLVEFDVEEIKVKFVGTERGPVGRELAEDDWAFVRKGVRNFQSLERDRNRLAAIVAKYFRDMALVFDRISRCIVDEGALVIVCGDNLVGGVRVHTGELLHRLLLQRGFSLVDSFTDEIRDRVLAPSRKGHQGLIKEEVVSCYRKG